MTFAEKNRKSKMEKNLKAKLKEVGCATKHRYLSNGEAESIALMSRVALERIEKLEKMVVFLGRLGDDDGLHSEG